MCKNPVIHDGVPIWCRKCDECRDARINDWVGRCLAEDRYCTHSHSVTLTYGRDDAGNADHIRAALLIYSDVQKMFKQVRKAGYKFKYLVAGEYGTRKRRAHWHVLFFWYGSVPEVVLEQNWQWPYWKHGHSQWKDMHFGSARYVAKYVQKEQGDGEAEAMIRMSKKPPIGHEWFQWWAREHVEQGLVPRSYHYSFEGVNLKDGRRRQFYMRGVTAENFMKAYCRAFVEKHGHIRFPQGEFLEEWLDKKYRAYYETETWLREKQNGKITEVYKRSVLEDEAEKHGGIRFYLPEAGRSRPALALCRDNTILEYGRPDASFIDRFYEILDGETGREITITTPEGKPPTS